MIRTVRIYCDDVSHEGREAKVALYVREDNGWQESAPFSAAKRRDLAERPSNPPATNLDEWIAGVVGPDLPGVTEHLAGDAMVSDLPGLAAAGPTRQRNPLRCPLCHLTVPVRHENLTPVLDRLLDTGVSRLTLVGLAARLK